MRILKYKATLFLAGLMTFSYFYFSSHLIYIPTKTLVYYGFSTSNLLTALSYPFLHVSPMHLLGNLLLVLLAGMVSEATLKSKHFIVLFFVSSIASAFVFLIISPDRVLVGASAGISAVIAAGFIVDFKKMLAGLLIVSVLVMFVSGFVNNYTMKKLSELRQERLEKEEQLKNVTNELKNAVPGSEEYENLLTKKQEYYNQLAVVIQKQVTIEEGKLREKQVKTNALLHLTGAIVGILYVWLFKRDLLWKLPYQLIPSKYLQKS